MMVLPWTPLALAGGCWSLRRALGRDRRAAGDRLLWAWAVDSLLLLALGDGETGPLRDPCGSPLLDLGSAGARSSSVRDFNRDAAGPRPASDARPGPPSAPQSQLRPRLRGAIGPQLDRRGVEWAFYEDAARQLKPGEPVALLYHVPEWDRLPYETPFGPVPHDWAVRLFYLNHPAPCRFGFDELAKQTVATGSSSFAVIGRASDLAGLERLGHVDTIAQGPPVRSDRTYRLYRVTPPALAAKPAETPRR